MLYSIVPPGALILPAVSLVRVTTVKRQSETLCEFLKDATRIAYTFYAVVDGKTAFVSNPDAKFKYESESFGTARYGDLSISLDLPVKRTLKSDIGGKVTRSALVELGEKAHVTIRPKEP